MMVLTKTEIIEELKRIGLDNPPEIPSHLEEYRRYCIRENVFRKRFLFRKFIRCLALLINPFFIWTGKS